MRSIDSMNTDAIRIVGAHMADMQYAQYTYLCGFWDCYTIFN